MNCVGFETPLIVAAGIGLTDILKCLVLAGADPNVHDSVSLSTLLLHGCSLPYLMRHLQFNVFGFPPMNFN